MLFFDRQLALNLDLFKLWEVDRGAKDGWEGGASWLLRWGVCLPAFKGHSRLNGFLGLCSWVWFQRAQDCGILLPLGPPLTGWNGTSLPRCESSLPEQHCSRLARRAVPMAFFKWSLLLLYKPSFKIDYKMFLNLPNTH